MSHTDHDFFRYGSMQWNAAATAEWMQRLFFISIQSAASDVHIEPQRARVCVRLRVDGILYVLCELPHAASAVIVNYLKTRAQLDISEKRLPQDGRYVLQVEHQSYVCRLSTFPTLYGEKVVLRFLNTHIDCLPFSALCLDSEQQEIFLRSIRKPQGLILLTGPTGSGKTTTLYTALSLLNTTEKNIHTIEDPIEIELDSVNQLNICSKIGLDFCEALRALLRQDPDIIMVGEIRDLKTAIMAIHAAQTGHLVLSTAHTNDALETLMRFSMMGLAWTDLLETLTLIVAQRLIRKLCVYCKRATPISQNMLESLCATMSEISLSDVFEPVGCAQCVHGYRGRIPIYQFFELNQKIKISILEHTHQVHQLSQYIDLKSLWQAGMEKVLAGITSISELRRVVGPPQV